MENRRKKLKFELFFEKLFANFGKIILTNLLFAVPSALVFVVLYFLSQAFFGGFYLLFFSIAIVLLYPFYSGVVLIARNITKGDSDIKVVSTYFSAVRHNFLTFLLHGVFVCVATILSYFALSVYGHLLSVSWIMYVLLFFCILVVMMALYTSFYLPMMSLTYDLKLRYIYKNCFLMSFGEFKHNFFATLALAVFGGICLTATAFLPSTTVLIVVLAILWALIIPTVATLCYVFFVYDGMVAIIENKDASGRDKQDGASAVKDKPVFKPEDEDYSDIDIRQLRDTDDFIFHNGRMVKQSTLLRILREKEAADKEDTDE